MIVHFDMPTTLRIAEQRVGRVDRMDSPYERIEVWWPADGPSFATRSDDVLHARNDESASSWARIWRSPDGPANRTRSSMRRTSRMLIVTLRGTAYVTR
jgi:hypothetical protein